MLSLKGICGAGLELREKRLDWAIPYLIYYLPHIYGSERGNTVLPLLSLTRTPLLLRVWAGHYRIYSIIYPYLRVWTGQYHTSSIISHTHAHTHTYIYGSALGNTVLSLLSHTHTPTFTSLDWAIPYFLYYCSLTHTPAFTGLEIACAHVPYIYRSGNRFVFGDVNFQRGRMFFLTVQLTIHGVLRNTAVSGLTPSTISGTYMRPLI